MRTTLVAANGYLHDRRARALAHQLRTARHEVTVVAAGAGDDPVAGIVGVPARRPSGGGTLGTVLRRGQPAPLRRWLLDRDLAAAAGATTPDLLHPTTAVAVDAAADAARTVDAAVVVDPRWTPPRDVWATTVVPTRPALEGAGGLGHHTPGWSPPSGTPAPDRHLGTTVVLVYRRRDVSPGRHLHDALERAGVEVLAVEERLDTAQVPTDAAGIVFVESPLPAVEVVGPPATVPTALWVHHGEHHLDANLRLAARYGVDHVLLAHSWHLAHRFAQPATRFPFGLPHAPGVGGRPWSARSHDVAMVGSHLDGGGPYARRGELVARARAARGADACAFVAGIGPEELVAVYGDARIVLNELGTRHHPITMRVFEALAGGALLLGDESPGLSQLLDPALTATIAEPFEEQLAALLADPDSPELAAEARAVGRRSHTYDHRVDELLAVLRGTVPADAPRTEPSDPTTLAGAVDRDPQVQVLVQVAADEVAEAHPDREVWRPDELGDRLVPRAVEAAVVRAEDVTSHLDVLRSAWRYVYVEGRAAGLEEWLDAEHPAAHVTVHGDVRRVDLGASGYLVRPERP